MAGPLDLYRQKFEAGEIRDDPGQGAALSALQGLYDGLGAPLRRRWWGWGSTAPPLASVYLHGPVGRGKSMVMDLLVLALETLESGQVRGPQGTARARVQRVHFHAFMLDVHQRVHRLQQAGAQTDPLLTVAKDLAEQSQVLCFDEFVVNNIADAMILGRLFSALWDQGLILIATSNFAPADLYPDGLHRSRFLPFIDQILARMQVVEVAGAQDHRTLQGAPADLFFAPLTLPNRVAFEDAYKRLSRQPLGGPQTLTPAGRPINLAWVGTGVAMATFNDLCAQPLGAADYGALAETFQALALDEVPPLTFDLRNEATRFRILIDTLYEAGTLLVLRSAVPVEDLYDDQDTENRRTVSRLKEMRARAYVTRALAKLDQQSTRA